MYVMSTSGATLLEDAAAASADGPRWFQLYMQPDRDETAKLLARQGMPHALWCGSDLMTEGCLQALARQDGGASAAHRPVVSSVNHVPALLKLIHDGQVSCTAAGHFVSAA